MNALNTTNALNTINSLNTMNANKDLLKKKRPGKIARKRRGSEIAFLILEAPNEAEQRQRRGFEKREAQWTINEYSEAVWAS